jgi:hypothetical protein
LKRRGSTDLLIRRVILLAAACGLVAAARAEEVSVRGYVGADTRVYMDRAAFPGQESTPFSLLAEPQLVVISDDRRKELQFVPYVRRSFGTDRESADIRDLFGRYRGAGWSGTIGISRVFWGATESHHMIDIINQSDLREDYRGDFKLGQPMVLLALDHPWGQIEALALPGFRERRFAKPRSRPRLALPIQGQSDFPDGKDLDWALRGSFSKDRLDAHLYHFEGLSREPDLLPVFDATGAVQALRPSYRRISQTGLDFTYAHGALIAKGEFLSRSGYSRNFIAGVVGGEYVLGAGASGADRALFLEYLFDRRPDDAPPPLVRRGWFLGARYAANDSASSEIRGGIIFDRDSGARAARIEGSRRILKDWSIVIEYIGFSNVERSVSLGSYGRDSYFRMLVRRHF